MRVSGVWLACTLTGPDQADEGKDTRIVWTGTFFPEAQSFRFGRTGFPDERYPVRNNSRCEQMEIIEHSSLCRSDMCREALKAYALALPHVEALSMGYPEDRVTQNSVTDVLRTDISGRSSRILHSIYLPDLECVVSGGILASATSLEIVTRYCSEDSFYRSLLPLNNLYSLTSLTLSYGERHYPDEGLRIQAPNLRSLCFKKSNNLNSGLLAFSECQIEYLEVGQPYCSARMENISETLNTLCAHYDSLVELDFIFVCITFAAIRRHLNTVSAR